MNHYIEPCPAAEDDYMYFSLTLRSSTTVMIQCNAYVSYASDPTSRFMVRGDTMLVIVEEGRSLYGHYIYIDHSN